MGAFHYKITIFYLLFLLGNVSAKAQVKFVNEFLNIGVGGRAHGMFGSVVASVDDGTAGYWNPAGLVGVESPLQFNAMHANWFGGIANYDFLSVAKSFNNDIKSVGSITLIRMGIDNIPNTLNLIGPDGSVDYNRVLEFSAADYAAIFSYGRQLKEESDIRIGASAKVIHRSIGSFGSAWGFGFDIGTQFKLGGLDIGIAGRDITTTFNSWNFNLTDAERDVFVATGNDIPVSSTETTLPRLIFGIGHSKDNGSVSYLIEADLNVSTNGTQANLFSGQKFAIDPTFGIEIGINKLVYIRGGLGNIQKLLNSDNTTETSIEFQPNVGLGLSLGRLSVDYALTNIGSVSGVLASNIFSVKLDFESRNSDQ
jgi:hypothetical protein